MSAPGNKRTVIFVEDEALIRIDAVEMLCELGFHVEEAASAAEAFAMFGRGADRIGATVIDIGLPDKRGDLLAMELRAAHPKLAIIIASGASGDLIRAHFANDPLTAFADKPYRIEAVAELLRKLRTDL